MDNDFVACQTVPYVVTPNVHATSQKNRWVQRPGVAAMIVAREVPVLRSEERQPNNALERLFGSGGERAGLTH